MVPELSLSPVTAQTNTGPEISLSPPVESPPQESFESADNKAQKINFAAPDDTLTPEQIRDELMKDSSWETRARQVLSDKKALEMRAIRNDIVKDYTIGKQERNEPIVQEDLDFIRDLSDDQITILSKYDQKVVLETMFAERAVKMAIEGDTSIEPWSRGSDDVEDIQGPWERREPVNSEELSGTDEAFVDLITKRNIVQSVIADYEARNKDKNVLQKAGEFALSAVVPFYSWINSNDALGETSANAYLWGNNKQEQVQTFYGIQDPLLAKEVLENALKDIEYRDPGGARAWLQSMLAYSYTDQAADNIFAGLDIASVLPFTKAGKLVKGATSKASSLASGLKGMSARIRPTGVHGTPAAAARTTGHVYSTAYADVMAEFIKRAETQGQKKSAQDILNDAPTMFNVRHTITSTTAITPDVADDIATTIERATSSAINNHLLNPSNIDRLDMANPRVAAEVESQVRGLFNAQYPSLSRNVLGYRHVASEDNLTNTDLIAVQLTKKDRSLWDDEVSAAKAAKRMNLPDAKPVLHPSGKYFLEVYKSIDENADTILNEMVSDIRHQTPDASINMFIGALASKDAKVSTSFAEDIKTATYGRSNLFETVRLHVEGINKIAAPSREKLRTFLIRERDMATPSGKPGANAMSQVELEDEWRMQFGDIITPDEAKAYWLFRNFNELDYVIRNNNLYKAKSRLGLENHYIRVPIDRATQKAFTNALKAGGTPATPKWARNFSTVPLEGKTVGITQDAATGDYIMPWQYNEKNTTILYIDENGFTAHYNKAFLTKAQNQTIVSDAYLNNRSTIIQLSPFEHDKLAEILGKDNVPQGHVAYVVSPLPRTEALPLRQLSRQPGFHREIVDGYFLSQPRTTQTRGSASADLTIYKGDANHSHYVREADAKTIRPHLENARRLLIDMYGDGASPASKARAKADLKAYLRAHLPYSYGDFKKQFRESGGGPDAAFSIYAPFLMRRSGQRLADAHNLKDYYGNFDDLLNNDYNLYKGQVDLQYAMEKSDELHTVVDNIVSPAEMLDPFIAYERAASKLANSGYLEDLKLKNATLVVTEFRDILNTSWDDLTNHPMKYIMNPEYLPKIDPKRKAQFKGARRALIETLGIESEFTRSANTIKRSISNYISENVDKLPWVGGKITKRQAYDLTENLWQMSIMKDPAQFIRSFAFHTKIGLFNPLQWFMQAQGIVHTAALESLPRAYQGAAAAFLMRGPLINPDTIRDFAKRANALGWTTEDFIESFDALRRSGFGHVGREFGNLADLENGRVVSNGLGKALDKAGWFFKDGERLNRLTAWNASYLRWKAKNPGKQLKDQRDLQEVLNRADLLALNMSQGSNAMWQKGWIGIPTQFMSYQARLMEQMLGRRLSGSERIRAFAAYSAMYGLPIGIAGTTLGGIWSAPKDIQAHLLNQGIDVDESILTKVMVRGIADVVFNAATDEDMGFGDRFGPGGNVLLRDLINGDTTMWEGLMGASGKVLGGDNNGGILAGTFGLVGTAIATTLSEQDDFLPLTGDALHNLLSSISTYNNVMKGLMAYNTGQYVSRNGLVLDSVSGSDAIIMGLTGTQPQELNDAFLMLENIQAINATKKEAVKQYKKYLNLALKSHESQDDMIAYLRVAKGFLVAGGLNPYEKAEALREALSGQETFVDSIAKQHSEISTDTFNMFLRKISKKQQ